MPAATISTTAGPAFRVPVGAFGFRVRNLSDTTIYWRDSADVATSGDTMGMPLDPGQEHVEVYDKDNKNPRAIMMLHGGSGSKSIVYDFLQVQLQAISGSPVAATVTVTASDIEIGAVEPKDADTDNRANIKPANTARSTSTNVLAVQHVDAAGNVLPASPVLGAGSAAIGSTKDGGPAWTTSRGVSGARFTSADQSGSFAAVTDAPTSGQKLCITDLLISSDAGLRLDFAIEDATGTIIETIYMAANETKQITPRGKWKLATADKKLMVQASAAGNISITPFYFSEA